MDLHGALTDWYGLADTPYFFGRVGAREPHHHVFDDVGIGNLLKHKSFLLGSCLYVHIAKIEEGREEPFNRRGDVLNTGELELADLAIEEALLLDIDDTFARNDPDIEVVINPRQKSIYPEKQEKSTEGKGEEGGRQERHGVRKENWNGYKQSHIHDREQTDIEIVQSNIQPVAVNNAQHLLSLPLALKMVA